MKTTGKKDDRFAHVEALLQDLPREKASPGFAERTIRASQKPAPFRFFNPMMVTAALVMIGAGLSWGILNHFRPTLTKAEARTPDSTDIEALKMLEEMNRELEAMGTAPQTQQPYLRVQGAAHNTYLIDMRSFAAVASKTAYAQFKPTRTL